MSNRNTTDRIEDYLKNLLEDAGVIEIQRSKMATKFNVVPSAINYVINTRFTTPQGYTVISKRGGGGFIRIEKVEIASKYHFIQYILSLVQEELSEKDAIDIVHKGFAEQIFSEKVANLMISSLTNIEEIITSVDLKTVNRTRANLMRTYLNRLTYE